MIAAVAAGLALSAISAAASAAAPSMKSVAGTYSVTKVEAFGEGARGQMILTPNGYYSIVITRAKMAPISAGARNKGTDAENKAVVDGSIGHFGKYTIDDGGKAITFHVTAATFPNWDGKPQKRVLKLKGDTLTYTVATPSNGGAPNDVVWKRVK
jgi:hypothetical protein